jgi:hypothetical protein
MCLVFHTRTNPSNNVSGQNRPKIFYCREDRKMGKFKKAVLAAGAASLVAASNASAALDFTGVTLDTGDVDTVMLLIIGGLATLWGFRKVIKTMNRS